MSKQFHPFRFAGTMHPAFQPVATREPSEGLVARYTVSAPVRLDWAGDRQIVVTVMLESEFPSFHTTARYIRLQGITTEQKGGQQ